MNTRRIEEHLTKVINDLADSIPSGQSEIREIIKRHSIISGGSIMSLLTSKPVKDYDIYFDSASAAYKIARYYTSLYSKINNMSSTIWVVKYLGNNALSDNNSLDFDRIRIKVSAEGEGNDPSTFTDYNPDFDSEDISDPALSIPAEVSLAMEKAEEDDSNFTSHLPKETLPFQPVFLTNNAISLTGRIQLIIRFFGTPDEIHSNFDFVHCTNYFKYDKPDVDVDSGYHLHLRPEALQSIITNDLRYIGSKYPVASIIRLRKFISRGWHVNAGQIFKIIYQASKLDLNNYSVLREQLIGVDVAYFLNLLFEVRKAQADFRTLDSSYIINLIDKIF